MVAEDSITEQVREPFRRDRRVAGEQMALLGEPVHEYADRVEPFGDGEASDEVNGKVLPRLLWDGQGLENAVRRVPSRFGSSAGVAVTDEAFDIFPHGGPVVTSGKEFKRLRSSWVADCRRVVVVLHEPKAYSLVVGHVAAVTVQELSVTFRAFR